LSLIHQTPPADAAKRLLPQQQHPQHRVLSAAAAAAPAAPTATSSTRPLRTLSAAASGPLVSSPLPAPASSSASATRRPTTRYGRTSSDSSGGDGVVPELIVAPDDERSEYAPPLVVPAGQQQPRYHQQQHHQQQQQQQAPTPPPRSAPISGSGKHQVHGGYRPQPPPQPLWQASDEALAVSEAPSGDDLVISAGGSSGQGYDIEFEEEEVADGDLGGLAANSFQPSPAVAVQPAFESPQQQSMLDESHHHHHHHHHSRSVLVRLVSLGPETEVLEFDRPDEDVDDDDGAASSTGSTASSVGSSDGSQRSDTVAFSRRDSAARQVVVAIAPQTPPPNKQQLVSALAAAPPSNLDGDAPPPPAAAAAAAAEVAALAETEMLHSMLLAVPTRASSTSSPSSSRKSSPHNNTAAAVKMPQSAHPAEQVELEALAQEAGAATEALFDSLPAVAAGGRLHLPQSSSDGGSDQESVTAEPAVANRSSQSSRVVQALDSSATRSVMPPQQQQSHETQDATPATRRSQLEQQAPVQADPWPPHSPPDSSSSSSSAASALSCDLNTLIAREQYHKRKQLCNQQGGAAEPSRRSVRVQVSAGMDAATQANFDHSSERLRAADQLEKLTAPWKFPLATDLKAFKRASSTAADAPQAAAASAAAPLQRSPVLLHSRPPNLQYGTSNSTWQSVAGALQQAKAALLLQRLEQLLVQLPGGLGAAVGTAAQPVTSRGTLAAAPDGLEQPKQQHAQQQHAQEDVPTSATATPQIDAPAACDSGWVSFAPQPAVQAPPQAAAAAAAAALEPSAAETPPPAAASPEDGWFSIPLASTAAPLPESIPDPPPPPAALTTAGPAATADHSQQPAAAGPESSSAVQARASSNAAAAQHTLCSIQPSSTSAAYDSSDRSHELHHCLACLAIGARAQHQKVHLTAADEAALTRMLPLPSQSVASAGLKGGSRVAGDLSAVGCATAAGAAAAKSAAVAHAGALDLWSNMRLLEARLVAVQQGRLAVPPAVGGSARYLPWSCASTAGITDRYWL